MTESERIRVRPWLRHTAIVFFVVLLPIAVHALWDYIEARRLSIAIEAIRARGEVVYSTGYVAGTPSPEQQLAARYYAAAAILARDASSSKFRDINNTIGAMSALSPGEAARDPRVAQLQRVLDEYAPVFDLLDRASALDSSATVRFNDLLRYPVPDLYLANINAVRIARLSFAGDAEGASKTLSQTLNLRNMSFLWSLGVDTTSSLRILLTLSPPSPDILARLQEEYQGITDDKQVEKALIESRARLITSVWPAASGQMSSVPRVNGLSGFRAPVMGIVLRPWLTREITRRLVEYDEALAVAREPWPARLDHATALADRNPEPPSVRSGGLALAMLAGTRDVPPMNVAAADLRGQSRRAAVETARQGVAISVLAIERFRRAHAGTLPASLGELVPHYLAAVPSDPYNGASLVFTRSTRGYKVYSVGANRTDDGGDWGDVELLPSRLPRVVVPKDIGIDIRY